MPLNKAERAVLTRIRRLLEMDEKSFGGISYKIARVTEDGVLCSDPEDAYAFIREQTRIWRETWILPYLQAVLDADPHALRWMSLDS